MSVLEMLPFTGASCKEVNSACINDTSYSYCSISTLSLIALFAEKAYLLTPLCLTPVIFAFWLAFAFFLEQKACRCLIYRGNYITKS